MASLSADLEPSEARFWRSIRGVSWGLVLLICTAAGCGIAELYSAADGSMQPWATRQAVRFAISLILMVGAGLLDIRYWFRAAYWVYAVVLALVIAVDLRGFVGGLGLLALYSLIIVYGFAIALRSRNHFGRLLGLSIVTNFFLSVFINTAMVMGLIPVVGVPLPLISYGGTAMLAVMFGFGLLINVGVHRDTRLNRNGDRRPG